MFGEIGGELTNTVSRSKDGSFKLIAYLQNDLKGQCSKGGRVYLVVFTLLRFNTN